jgi:integral membrane sensor domain MASE1
MLLSRCRLWPGLWAGGFLVNYYIFVTSHSEVLPNMQRIASAGIATGNTLESVIAVVLIQQFAGGRRVYERSAGVFRYFLYAAVIGCSVSATIGVSMLQIVDIVRWGGYGLAWVTWWLGDAVSTLTVAPLLVVWATRRPPIQTMGRALEMTALLCVLTGVSLLQWGPWLTVGVNRLPMGYIVIPPLLWAAFRFYQHGAVTAVGVLCSIAVWGTLQNRGPFAVAGPHSSLLLLQTFCGTMAVTGLILSAVVSEHRSIEATQRQAENRLRQLAESEQSARREAESANRT